MAMAISIYNSYAVNDEDLAQITVGYSLNNPAYISYAKEDLGRVLGQGDLPDQVHEDINNLLEESAHLSVTFYNTKARIEVIKNAATEVGLPLLMNGLEKNASNSLPVHGG